MVRLLPRHRTVRINDSTSCTLGLLRRITFTFTFPRLPRYRTVRIDGSTSMDDRQTIVDNFNLFNAGQVRIIGG